MTALAAWLRTQRWYLPGVLLLAPVAFWLSASESWATYASRNRVSPIVVAKGASADYAGASWRLLSIDADDRLDVRGGRPAPLPVTLAVVRVRLEVTAQSAEALAALRACQGTLRDARGRRWEANPTEIGRRAKRLPESCADWRNPDTFKTERAEQGRPWTFEQAYLVPRSAIGDVVPEMSIARELPRYLRFQR